MKAARLNARSAEMRALPDVTSVGEEARADATRSTHRRRGLRTVGAPTEAAAVCIAAAPMSGGCQCRQAP